MTVIDRMLEKRLERVEERNSRVSLDKAWETSWTRKIAIATLTYIVVVAYLIVINNDRPWVNALVPVVGYLLSTLAVGWVRILWQKNK